MTDTGATARPAGAIPALTAAQMAAVDRLLVEEIGVGILQLMEVAGHAVAAFARDRFLGGDVAGRRVLVLAGAGNNGGDGLVAARYLHAWGADIAVRLATAPESLRDPAAHQFRALAALGVPVAPPPAPTDAPPTGAGSGEAADPAQTPGTPAALPVADLVVDALLGFGLARAPTGAVAALIDAADGHPAPTLAVDVPSGLDADTGDAFAPCVRATATLTLALPKVGLLAPSAGPVVGELHLADIGVPPSVYARLGHAVGPLFARASRFRLA